MTCLLTVGTWQMEASPALTAAVSLGIFVGGTVLVARTGPLGFWSPQVIYLLILGVFHLGLAPNMILGIDPKIPAGDYYWYRGELFVRSLHLVDVAVLAYTLGVLAYYSMAPRGYAASLHRRDMRLAHRLAQIGRVLLLLSVMGWFVLSVKSVGIAGLFGSYLMFLDATAADQLGLTYLGMGLGLSLAAIEKPNLLGWVTLIAFGAFATIGFLLGLRGEVLFTVAAAIPVWARHAKMPRASTALAATLALLTLISAGREIRNVGVASFSSPQDIAASPLSALVELGTSIRVVAVVLGWHDAGDSFRGGDTYFVVIARFFESSQALPRIDSSIDYRLFNIEISNRVGLIGGSVIGEAYHNFALTGVAGAAILTGIIFAHFGRKSVSVFGIGMYCVIAAPLLNHVRNSFVSVVPALAFGLILIAIVKVLTPLDPERESEGTAIS